MTLYRVVLRDLIVCALKKAQTLARNNVVSPGDTPSADSEYPKIIVRTPYERKDSLGRNTAPQFNTVATISVAGQIEAPTEEAAEAALDTFAEQIEQAVINDYELTKKIQQFLFVETKIDITSEGAAHAGQVTINFGLEFYQGSEQFAPIETDPLEQVDLTADMADPFDKLGVYKDALYPQAVTSPTRTSGPDGRAEAGFIIDLPQEN